MKWINKTEWASKRSLLALAVTSAVCSMAQAGPEGGEVVGGAGDINHNGSTTTINQATDRMAINWQSFDVAADERVQFIQPSSSSIALNNILSNHGSKIQGQIDANGQVFLINPNGVIFGGNATVNVGGILASGLSINPEDFMNNNFAFSALENAEGKVINSGLINAATGGSVTLLGKQVSNEGLIVANLGAVNLAAGKEAVLTFDAAGLMGVYITQAMLQAELGVGAALENNGSILAHGGQVLLTASVSEDVFSQAIRMDGEAKSAVVNADGSFTLGGGSRVTMGGVVDVSATPSGSDNTAGRTVILGENVDFSGQVLAQGAAGDIEIHAQDTVLVTDQASVSVNNASGTGGTIKLLGDKVGILDQAQVTATGAKGGGRIFLGGDETGGNKTIRNANFVYTGELSRLDASATGVGSGGSIIAFAENSAQIYGALAVLGGEQGGEGGFVETSGLAWLDLHTVPEIGARTSGSAGGLWLIDPYNLVVQSSGNMDSVAGVFTSGNLDTVLAASRIQDALESGDVTLRTGSGGSDAGNITVNSSITAPDVEGTRTLTLQAHNNITFNASINPPNDGDALNLDLQADYGDGGEGDGMGSVFLLGAADILTRGGNLSVSGVDFEMRGVELSGGDRASLVTDGGSVTMNLTGDVKIDTLYGDSGEIQSAGARIETSGGVISINARDFSFGTETENGESYIRTTRGAFNLSVTGDVKIYEEIDTAGGAINIGDTSTSAFPNSVHLQRYNAANSAVLDTSVGGNNNTAGNITITANSVRLGSDFDVNAGGANGTDGAVAIRLEGNDGNVQLDYTAEFSHPVTLSAYSGSTGHSLLSANRTNEWTITGNNAGLLNINLSFTGIENLTGNSNVDQFVFAGIGDAVPSLSGTLNGGDGADTLTVDARNLNYKFGYNYDHDGDPSASTPNVTVNQIQLASDDSIYLYHVQGVEDFVGSTANDNVEVLADELVFNFSGNGGTDSLFADTDETNKWVINDEDDSQPLGSGASDSALTTDTGTEIYFRGFSSIAGGDNPDLVTLNEVEILSGLISGGDGVGDRLNITQSLGVTVSLESGEVGGDRIDTSGFEEINSADSASILTLQYSNAPESTAGNYWQMLVDDGDGDTVIDGVNDGQVQFGVTYDGDGNIATSTQTTLFTDFTQLTGSAADDQILVNNTAAAASTFVFDGGNGSDTVIGDNVSNTWTLDLDIDGEGTDTGTFNLNDNLTFSNIENLTGGSLQDTFNLVDGGTVTGLIDGGAPTSSAALDVQDVLEISGSGGVKIYLGADDSVLTNVINVERLTTNNAYAVLGVATGATKWMINSSSGGTVESTEDSDKPFEGSITFSGFQTLEGANGNGIDTFDITANFAGSIDGRSGDDVFKLSTAITGTITGGIGTDSISVTGTQEKNWVFNGGDTETVSWTDGDIQTLNFIEIESILGADDSNDIFNIGADDSNDIFNITVADIILSIDGGGSAGRDSLVLSHNLDSKWTINGVGDESVEWDIDPSEDVGLRTVTFSGIESATGGDGIDTFNVTAVFAGALAGAGGDDVFNLSTGVTGGVTGGTGDDYFVINSSGFDLSIGAGEHTLGDTLDVGHDTDATWTMGGAGHSVQWTPEATEFTISLNGFERYLGGGGADDFKVQTQFEGAIDGGGGTNSLTATNTSVSDVTYKWAVIADGDTTTLYDGTLDYNGDDTVDLVFSNVQSWTANGEDSHSLAALNQNNTWAIDQTGSTLTLEVENSASNLLSLTGFTELQGGTAVDEFNINSSYSGTLLGGVGNDTFTVTKVGVVTTVKGGTGENSLTARPTDAVSGSTNFWTISDGNSGELVVSADSELGESESGITFSGITTAKGSETYADIVKYEVVGAGISFAPGGDAGDKVDFSSITEALSVSEDALTGFESVVGNNHAQSTFTAANVANTWEVDSSNGGSLNTVLAFSAFPNLIGGTSTDQFTLTTYGEVTGSINGGGGENTLAGRNANTTWAITGGAIDSTSPQYLTDTSATSKVYVKAFTAIQNFQGGTDDDIFKVSGTATLAGADGGDGTDTVDFSQYTGDNIIVELGDHGSDFSSIESYTGDGTTNTTLAIATTITGAVDWELNGENDGTVSYSYTDDSEATQNPEVTFKDFANLTGGTGKDTFDLTATAAVVTGLINGGGGASDEIKAPAIDNLWTITESGNDSLAYTHDTTDYQIEFSAIEILTGNSANDTFKFDSNTIAMTIAGKDGTKDTLDFTAIANNVEGSDPNDITVDLSGSTSPSIAASGIESIKANGANSNTLIGYSVGSNWGISAPDAGKVTSKSDSISTFDFSGFKNLTGSSTNADSFALTGTGTVTGEINGNIATNNSATNNSITGRNVGTEWTISNLNTGSSTHVTKFSNIHSLSGGSEDDIFNFTEDGRLAGEIKGDAQATDGADQITALVGNNTWLFTAEESSLTRSGTKTIFSEIESISGGSGVDTFTVESTSTIPASASAGGDGDVIDVVDLSNLTSANVDLSEGSVLGITGAEKVEGNGTDSQITGWATEDTQNFWSLTGVNDGKVENKTGETLNSSIQFEDFVTLQGTNIDDTFTVSEGSLSAAGKIKGGGGSNTLVGPNADSQWSVTRSNEGKLRTTSEGLIVDFVQIHNLQGGSKDDAFSLSSMSLVTSIDGGEHTLGDTLDFSESDDDVTVQIGASSTGFENIERFKGNGESAASTFSSQLKFMDDASASSSWNITGVNDGSITYNLGSGENTIDFIDFNILTGTAGDDTFTLANNSAAITGSIDGGSGGKNQIINSGSNGVVFNVAGTAQTVTNIVGGASSVAKFSNINSVAGLESSTNQLLYNSTADDTVSWEITGADAGEVGVFSFTNIDQLVGTLGVDVFDFTTTTSAITGKIDGGSGVASNQIDGPDLNVNWSVNGETNSAVGSDTDTTVIAEFDNIQSLNGGAGSDKFTYLSSTGDSVDWDISASEAGSVGGFSFTEMEALVGAAGDDSFTINNSNTSLSVVGGAGRNELFTDLTSATTWDVDGSDSGSLENGTGTISFDDIDVAKGGTGVDTFNVTSAFDGSIYGGAGADEFNINANVTGGVFGEAGTDDFILAGGLTTVISGGTAGDGEDDTLSIVSTDTTANSWIINSTNSGSLNTAAFTSIESIQAGAGADTFAISAAFVGSIGGGNGSDTFNINATDISLTLVGGDNSGDTLNLNTSANATWDLDGSNTVSNGTGTVDFSGMQVLNGADSASVVDTFNITSAFTGNINGRNGADIFNIDAVVTGGLDGGGGGDSFALSASVSGNVSGGSGGDTFNILADGVTFGALQGNGGTDALNLTTSLASAWSVDGASSTLTFDGNTSGFSGMESLSGGSGVDSFNVVSAFSGSISGNAGKDSFSLGADVSGTVSGGDNSDTFTVNQAQTGSIVGGTGADEFNINANVTGGVFGE
uniref:filamentous hemagglutinin N-terminal domain-containing protein n=1 Tax=Teredinibacter waterburyi TaxID=1500538 RepID=UPI00165FE745